MEKLYRDSEISFSVPAMWQEQSLVAFTAPTPESANIAMTRVALAPSETLRSYAGAFVAELCAHEPVHFDELAETELAGRPAVQGFAGWSDGGETVTQHLAVIGPAPSDPDGRAILLTLTARGAEALVGAETFAHLLASVRFAGDHDAASPGPRTSTVAPAFETAPVDYDIVPIPGSPRRSNVGGRHGR